MEQSNNLRQQITDRIFASEKRSIYPWTPTAMSETTGSPSPFYVDELKREEDLKTANDIYSGKAFLVPEGRDRYKFIRTAEEVDSDAFGEAGLEYAVKYNSSQGWGEQNYDQMLGQMEWWEKGTGNFIYNPYNPDDSANIDQNYLESIGYGINKWFVDSPIEERLTLIKEEILKEDPQWTEEVRISETDQFLNTNQGVRNVLSAGGIDLYDYTRASKNKKGMLFSINQAVIDASQNIRLKKYNEQTGMFGTLGDSLYYGLQDPLLARDILVTTALTAGLGTAQVGLARLGTAIGQTTLTGARAASTALTGAARAAATALQFTSPFTGIAEGVTYKGLQAVLPTVGKKGTHTALARALAISTEAGLQAGLVNYQDQKTDYEWKKLVFQDKETIFNPNWASIAANSAAGFGLGGLTMGSMRFGLGLLGGDLKLIRRGDWNTYWKEVGSSLDTWARTDKGLTVWGNSLSGGRGIILGDMIDKYMKNTIDGRDFTSILMNGKRLWTNGVFTPEIAAKANFDSDAAKRVADAYAEATGLPGEILVKMDRRNSARAIFDNFTDPEFLKQAGMTYEDARRIFSQYTMKRNVIGREPSIEARLTTLPKSITQMRSDDDVSNISQIMRLEVANRRLQQLGIEPSRIEAEFKTLTTKDIDFGVEIDRDNYYKIADYIVNRETASARTMDLMSYASTTGGRLDIKMPDGTVLKSDVISVALRKAIGLDNVPEGGRLFITDAVDGKEPTFVISVTKDGTVNRHAANLKLGSNGRVTVDIEATKFADYKPENIRTASDMMATTKAIRDAVDAEYAKVIKEAKAKTKADLDELAKTSEEMAEAVEAIGKLPTKNVLAAHFGLTFPEATVASIMMETLGMDLENMVLRIARASGEQATRLAEAGAKGAIEWTAVKSGVVALIRSTKESDFGTLAHEMGHYNRMLFIGNTDEHKKIRASLGITDDMWSKFQKWIGYDGVWEIEVEKMSKEQRIAEEKFANAWAYYIRNIMFGDGKSKDSSLHRLFSAFGDHLGDMGKKMQSQVELEKGLDFTPEAKEVYDKLFLRSEAYVTKFWNSAVKGVFASLPVEDRAKLGEQILGKEAFNTWLAKQEVEVENTKAKVDKVVSEIVKVKKEKLSDIIARIKAKLTGNIYEPTKKAITQAYRAGIPIADIETQVAAIRATLNGDMVFPDSNLRPRAGDSYFASHVEDLSDEQLSNLVEGTVLKPIPGVIKWFYNDTTKAMDVGFPKVIVTKELVSKELNRRNLRRLALQRLAELQKPKPPAEVKPDPLAMPERLELKDGWYAIRPAKPSEEELAKLAPDVAKETQTDIYYNIWKQDVDPVTGAVTKTYGGQVSFTWDSVNKMYRPAQPTGANIWPAAQGKGLYMEFLKHLSTYYDIASTGVDKESGTLPNAARVWQKLGAKRETLKPNALVAYTPEETGKPMFDSYVIRKGSLTPEREVIESAERIAAELAIDKTEPPELQEVPTLEPEEVIKDIKENTDKRFVSNGVPVENLSSAETIVLEARETVRADVENVETSVIETVLRAANPEIPIEQIKVIPVQVEPQVINIDATSSQTISSSITTATQVVSSLESEASTLSTQIPQNIVNVVDLEIKEISTDPEILRSFVLKILNDPENAAANINPEILQRYVNARSRFYIANEATAGFSKIEREDLVKYDLLSPETLSILENNPIVETLIRNPDDTELLDGAIKSTNLDRESILTFVTVRSQITQASSKAANDADMATIAMFTKQYEEYETDNQKLQGSVTQQEKAELEEAIKKNKVAHGKYIAAQKRIQNRAIYNQEIVDIEKQTISSKTIDEIFEEAKVIDVGNIVTIETDTERAIKALGIKHTDLFSVSTSKLKIPNIFSKPSEIQTAPILVKAKSVGGTGLSANDTRILGLIITNEIVNNSYKGNIEDLAIKLITDSTPPIQVASKIGTAVINENPIIYHGIISILTGVESSTRFRDIIPYQVGDLKQILMGSERSVSSDLKFLSDTINNYKTQSTAKITPRRLAWLLLTNTAFEKKMQKLLEKVAAQENIDIGIGDVVAKLYRTSDGIDNYFRKRLKLAETTTPLELLTAINDWAKGKTKVPALDGSLILTIKRENSSQTRGRSSKEVTGETTKEDGTGIFETLGKEAQEIEQKNGMVVASAVDALQALLYDSLKGKVAGNAKIPLQDYFLARITTVGQSGNWTTNVINKLRETTGIDYTLDGKRKPADILKTPDKELSREIELFSQQMLSNSPVDGFISTFISERFGIGVKQVKGEKKTAAPNELMQAVLNKTDRKQMKIEYDIGKQIRRSILMKEYKTLDSVLKVIEDSNSAFADIARMLREGKRRTRNVYVVPISGDRKTKGFFETSLNSIFLNYSKVSNFEPEIIIHEAIHAFSVSEIDEFQNFNLIGMDYLNDMKLRIDNEDAIRSAMGITEISPSLEIARIYYTLVDSTMSIADKSEINNPLMAQSFASTGEYGLYNMYEFISEAVSNPEFANILNQLPPFGVNQTSGLDSLYDAVVASLGIANPNANAILKAVLENIQIMVETKGFTLSDKGQIMLVKILGLDNVLPPTEKKKVDRAFARGREVLLKREAEARQKLKAAKGRLDQALLQAKPEDVEPLLDAVDLRRRNLLALGLHEETTPESMEMIQRMIHGLSPIDLNQNRVFDNIKSQMQSTVRKVPSKDFLGKSYRKMTDVERRDFVANTMLPKIREALGDRNTSAGIYSAVSDTTFGKKINSLIGGAVNYADTADSNSVILQFISKIFDPMMDMRDGELTGRFNLFSVDRMNAEANNMLMRSGLIKVRDKILSRVKSEADLRQLNDMAWMYLTRKDMVPEMPNRDLVLELIDANNKFNEITVEILSMHGDLAKGTDPKKYGTPHTASYYAKENPRQFVDALVNWAVRKTIKNNEISLLTSNALGWVQIRRDKTTDEIISISIPEGSPLAKLLDDEKSVGKKLDWNSKTKKMFSDLTKLTESEREIHNKGLVSAEDYGKDWKDAYGKRGDEYTAIRQSMEIAKNRYLGIDFTDSKSGSPRRISVGEGRNYDMERIITHDEIVEDPELHKFFNKQIFQLQQDNIRGAVTDAIMTKYLTELFGTKMSMDDLIQIGATLGEEVEGRVHMSQLETNSRERGYNRLRDAWNHSIGNWMSSKDSVDKYYEVLLNNSRIPLTIASGFRAAVTSVPEMARAILTSNKNKAMLRQLLPNMVKLVKLIGPGGKQRRLAMQQIISATHWMRGLSTDHMLNRNSIHPDNPFQGAVFGQGAGGMVGNFINTWRAAGQANKSEPNWLQRTMNRTAAFSSAAGAPLAFVNDVTTILHIWNAQQNFTENSASFLKLAEMIQKNPSRSYSDYAALAKKCGLSPKEALDLQTAGLLEQKYIKIILDASKDQSLYSDGILDANKLYIWAGEDEEKIKAINMMGGYINMTARHTNTEPTLLDIRLSQSIYARTLGQYMQFLLSFGVQEIGRRRRTMTSDYSKHLLGLLLMEVAAYGTTRALSDLEDDNKGGYDEFINNPVDYSVRTATSLPLLGSYAWLSQITRQAVMGTSEFFGGPGSEQDFRLPDLIGGPASTAPRRIGEIPDTVKSMYNYSHGVISDLIQE